MAVYIHFRAFPFLHVNNLHHFFPRQFVKYNLSSLYFLKLIFMELSYHKIFQRNNLSSSTLYSFYTKLTVWQFLGPQLAEVSDRLYNYTTLTHGRVSQGAASRSPSACSFLAYETVLCKVSTRLS